MRRMFARSLVLGVAAACCCVVVFQCVAALTLLIPRERIVWQIRRGFAEGSIGTAHFPPRDQYWRIGRDQWTDCATFQMSIRGDGSFLEELITPRRFSMPRETDPPAPCWLLQAAVSAEATAAALPTWRYHRYLHGTTTLARIGLSTLSVRALREAIRLSIAAAALLAIAAAVWLLGQGSRHRPKGLGTLVLCAVS